MSALRSLLAGIVDYAGLFPPSGLDMASAVREYASYLADDDAWMLGRFVVPIAQLGEFERARAALESDGTAHQWRVTALLGADIEPDVARARHCNAEHEERCGIDSLEAKVATADDIRRLGAAAGSEFTVFAEIPSSVDPAPLIESIKQAGINAKIRTGGVTAEAIPTPEAIVRFMRACMNAGVAFKATAGLHHPLRAEYPLTYETGAPTSTMFGYLNVFLAAAFMANGLPDADAIRLLDERDARAFDVTSDAVIWSGHRLTVEQARHIREHVAVSFGSCSFREPVDELRALALTLT